MKNKLGMMLNNIRELFCKVYSFVDISYHRPAFIRYNDQGYSTIKYDFGSLIINLKKEVDSMGAKELVLAQLEALNKEKEELVNAVLEAEKDTIATIKLKAAEEAEAIYKKEVETKVAGQFKIAEEHLTKLLEALPEETVSDEESETVVFADGGNTEETVI